MEGTRLNIVEKMSSFLFPYIHLAPLCQEPFPWNLTFSRTMRSLWLPDIARRIQEARQQKRIYVLIKTDSVTVNLLPLADEQRSFDVANKVSRIKKPI
jgi:hypothetical protein